MSLRITNAMLARNVITDINATADRLNRVRAKASSGREISRPSDDPAAAARALKLRESLDGTRQHGRNVDDALSFLEATERGMDGITQVALAVRDIVVQGATDSLDRTASKALAEKVRSLIDEAKELGNSTIAGRYVFSGTDTGTQPFPPADGYAGNTGTMAREIGPGVAVAVNIPGSKVLGSGAPGDLLGVLRGIADHLDPPDPLANPDRAALRTTDLKGLDGRIDALLGLRALNGATSERLEAAKSRLDQLEESTLGELSDTEDADFAKTMMTISTQSSAYEAALKAGANILQPSLMDFLR